MQRYLYPAPPTILVAPLLYDVKMDKRKHWIPLLTSSDEDDLDLTIRSPSKCRCSKKTIIYSIVLGLVIAFIDIAVIVGVTVVLSGNADTGYGVKHISILRPTDQTAVTSSVVQPTMSFPVSTSTPQFYKPSPTPSRYVMSLPISSTSVISLKTNIVMSTNSVVTPTPSVTPMPVNNENCIVDSHVCPSKLDDRKYRVMTLSNNLRVLLVSDPSLNISAAAMDVPAGSFNDPPDYEGLAHFCEHMLFIGTKKYPETNQYSHFLQTHGGQDNAYTSTQNTNYFFNVEAKYFSTALDMFAHFFIDPLFSTESMMDEINAVNAEHQKNLHSDDWKLWQLLKNVSNPLHPFSQFSTGSLETLNKIDTRDRLLHYFNSRYSANTVS